MPAAAIGAIGLGSVVGGYLTAKDQAKAQKSAAQMQANSANVAAENTMKMYNQTRDDLQPYVQTGQLGNTALAQGMRDGSLTRSFNLGDFHADPGYQFTRQQGLEGIQSTAAARGSLLSGATLKALNSFNNNLAAQQYQQAYSNYNADQANRYSRLMGVATLGQNSAAKVGASGADAVAQANDYTTSAASALGAAKIGAANARSNAFNNVLNTGATMAGMAGL